MNRKLDLYNGALLHDIGKISYRNLDQRNHSTSGYDFLKSEVRLSNKAILDQVHFHHFSLLKDAKLQPDNLSYITYFADNISAGIDRRDQETPEDGFDRQAPLDSIFNILNRNDAKTTYGEVDFTNEEKILYPQETMKKLGEGYYGRILLKLKEHLLENLDDPLYANSTLQLLESIWSYVPSSTSNRQRKDISLYDHSKLTAAIALALFDYFEANQITDYRKHLFPRGDGIASTDCLLLLSMDLSGIQDFIYTITSKGALKGLRTRSFYLDILMEYANDVLLDRLHLNRANLLYSGGGHSYLLLPNTEEAKQIIEDFRQEINDWCLSLFDVSLYFAIGYRPCSPNSLKNTPHGSYENLFRDLSNELSKQKSHRYPATVLAELNAREVSAKDRECIICHRTDSLDATNRCMICQRIEALSESVMSGDFFAVQKESDSRSGLPLPFGNILVAYDERELLKHHSADQIDRVYSKNKRFMGRSMATAIWVGDYRTARTFEELAKEAKGIRRIAVFRADVDDMGSSFVSGFKRANDDDTYVTLSRTSAFSRLMSEYFKKHINQLLEEGEYHLDGSIEIRPRNATVVYAGGDDLFIVGAWHDIIGFSVDLYRSFQKFNVGSMHLSAGIGLFREKHPIASMAEETGRLEDCAKQRDGKNSVSLFDAKNHTYSWSELIDDVLEEKLKLLRDYFNTVAHEDHEERRPEKNTALLYKLYELVEAREDSINIARLAYLLGRMRPKESRSEESKYNHELFSKKVYQYIRNETDAKAFSTALLLYVYLQREEKSHD